MTTQGPATPLAAESSAQELHRLFALQRQATRVHAIPTLAERVGHLRRIASLVVANRRKIQDAMCDDFGVHPRALTDLTEILGVAGQVEYAIGHLESWMRPDERAVDPQAYGDASARIEFAPKGVIGVLSPWNLPFLLSLGPLIDALGAGNRVILKPSEHVPASSSLLRELVHEGFEESTVAVVVGGVDLAREFTSLPWDHLVYTGSTETGRQVAMAAARNLVPVTLELGGKNPVIIDSDSVDAQTVSQVLGSKLAKSGQVCIAPDYCYVPRSLVRDFVHLSEQYVAGIGDYSRSDENTSLLALRHVSRIQSMVEEAAAAGSEVVTLGPEGPWQSDRQMPPVLVIDPPPRGRLMSEEIFGPVLPIVPYDSLDDVVEDLAGKDSALGLYVFTQDDDVAEGLLARTRSGGACVNTCVVQGVLPSLGFGGVGASGYGRHRGIEGFREFSVPRGVVTRGRNGDAIHAMFPPYSGMAQAIADMALGPS